MSLARLAPFVLGILLSSSGFPLPLSAQNSTPAAPRPIAELSFSQLTPDAVIALDLEPGAVATEDGLWVPHRSARTIVHVTASGNTVAAPVPANVTPCASLAAAFGSVWVPSCADGSLVRIAHSEAKAPAKGNASASIPLPVVAPQGSIAVAAGSVWVPTDVKGIVSRIDPETNVPVAEAFVAGAPVGVAASDVALWVTSESGDLVTRLDARTNVVLDTVKVGPQPGRLVIGEGAVWTLNRGDGSVTRIDPSSNKAVTTIVVGESIAQGDLAVGEGAVWISAPGVPLVRIDPRSNRVTQRFVGTGGGAIVAAHGSLWVNAGPKTTWRLDPRLVAAMRP